MKRVATTLVLRVTMGTKRDKCHKLRSYYYDVKNYYVSMMKKQIPVMVYTIFTHVSIHSSTSPVKL